MYYREIFKTKYSIDGSVVECSPATRAARVRFPVDALLYSFYQKFHNIFRFISLKTFKNSRLF